MQPSSLNDIGLETILLERKRLRRELLEGSNLRDICIAVLGGTTTNELVDILEIQLLRSGFRPTFYQSDYGRFYEDATLEPHVISALRPDLVYIHTSYANIRRFPPPSCGEDGLQSFVEDEVDRYRAIWASLGETVGCQIIQNNFELPANAHSWQLGLY